VRKTGESLFDGQDPPIRLNGRLTKATATLKKFLQNPLELFLILRILRFTAIIAVGRPMGPQLRRAPEGVRCRLVPILLFGGFGYEV
jgi:hypothetical protein